MQLPLLSLHLIDDEVFQTGDKLVAVLIHYSPYFEFHFRHSTLFKEHLMHQFIIEKLSERIPIVRNELWSVYVDQKPKFTGTLQECCHWVETAQCQPRGILNSLFSSS
jgi:hypothetical protein